MLKLLYLIFHYLALFLISLIFIALLIVYHPSFFTLISKQLADNDIVSFSRIEGAIGDKIILHNMNYKDQLFIEKMTIKYNLLSLIFEKKKINSIEIIKPLIKRELFENESHSSSDTKIDIPDFLIESIVINEAIIQDSLEYQTSLDITNLAYKMSSYTIEKINTLGLHVKSDPHVFVALKADKLRYDTALHVKDIRASVDVDNNRIELQGAIKNNTLKAHSHMSYNPRLTQEIDSVFVAIPKRLALTIEAANFQSAKVTTRVEYLAFQEHNITLSNNIIEASFNYSDDYLALHVRQDINESKVGLSAEHHLRVGFDGSVVDNFILKAKAKQMHVPFETLEGVFEYHHNQLALALTSPCSQTKLHSSDLNRFTLQSSIRDLNLSFIPSLPPSLKKYPISSDLNLTYHLSTDRLKGEVNANTEHTSYRGSLRYDTKHFSTDGTISTDGNTSFWKSVPLKNMDTIHLITDLSLETSMLYLNSEELHVTLFEDNKNIEGWGSFSSSEFNFRGNFDENRTLFNINSSIPSLYTAIDSLYDMNLSEGMIFDCEVDVNATVLIDETLHVSTALNLPWYLAMSDEDNIIYGTDANISLSVEDNVLRIDRYNIDLFGREFFATKPSTLHVSKNSRVDIETFWINDGIQVDGSYGLDTKVLQLNANAESYHYKGEEGEGDIDLHVRLYHDENSTSVEGQVELKEMLITYKPIDSGVINDEDIIVIQDVKAPKKSPLALNIQIFSSQAIRYKTKQIDVTLTPDITLYKEPEKELELLGWVVTDQGRAWNSGSEYTIKKSELYFAGGESINPYLNLHLFYEIDLKEIDIYVTHMLSSPVMLFTSNPPMSQSDIISYLLFGTPANDSFESDSSNSNGINAANIFLGTGLKQMIGDTTGLGVDTLNLLSKKDGGVGFEVGTRISRDVRVILKNDDIFSMVLQMNLSRNLRLDVDVQETGQGVNIIYVKDYEDIFNHSASN
ncbi:MAG: translocation/assembly module TamB domain-containing protein [Campylobacterota bacterium]|nr:translocation/assembly module TamB domain-containing protein [Campylobacterota bacterium]